MALFKSAVNMQAYLKCGILGFAGSGKTFTASEIAIGLHKLVGSSQPVFFLDTETGSDWMQKRFRDAGIELCTSKTRAFANLLPAVKEAEQSGAILIIDSITHFWRELTESYAQKKNRTRGLEFQDWAWLKKTWGGFTDAYVNSQCHIIMCGRAGFEYDYFENNDGKKELQKTGIKMKAEGETGYEPSLLILMEREIDIDTKKVRRTAYVLKDRSDTIDGKAFVNPKFEAFAPHFKYLNIGGKHVGVDTSADSTHLIENPNTDWRFEQQQRDIYQDEIETLLVEHYPSQKAEDKAAKIQLLKDVFGTAAWTRIKTFDSAQLKAGYLAMLEKLEPHRPPPPSDKIPPIPGAIALEDDEIPELFPHSQPVDVPPMPPVIRPGESAAQTFTEDEVAEALGGQPTQTEIGA